jgi:glutathione S-transferase
MSSYKVLGHAGSTCTRTVVATLEEVGAPYELQTINFGAGEHKAPEYLAKHQPFGQIPVLYDGDFRIFESRAIAKYVADNSKNDTLYPADLKKRALVEQWLSVNQSNSSPITNIVVEFFFGPAFYGKTADATKTPALKEALNKLFDILEAQLKTSKFIAGDEFTLADIVWLPYLHYLTANCPGFENVFDGHSHLKAWWQACTTRASWKKATASGF